MKPTKYFTQVVNRFEDRYDPSTVCKEVDKEFLLHPFKINKFSTRKLTVSYKLLTQRYLFLYPDMSQTKFRFGMKIGIRINAKFLLSSLFAIVR